jgi:D-alanyl-D-alanine carboxypeptidase
MQTMKTKNLVLLSLILINILTVLSAQEILYAEDYLLAPVDRYYRLPASYSPEVEVFEFPGRPCYLTKDTGEALTLLFEAAAAAGFDLEIASSYRSYETQLRTHEYWIDVEIANGLSPAAASIEAKKYSAVAGHSEHQLGTAVDINEIWTPRFQQVQDGLFFWLSNNAHKFGFVISYPPGREEDTGYVFEPWHLRYMGVELATEFRDQGYLDGGPTVNLFLRYLWFRK